MGLASELHLIYLKGLFVGGGGGTAKRKRRMAFLFHVLLSMHHGEVPFPAEKPR